MLSAETPVTLILLLLNVLVSAYALFSDPSLIGRLAFRPYQILRAKQYYRLISAGFVHVGLGHLAFNMITLFFFGPQLELLLGSGGFAVLYLGSELAAHGLSLWLKRDDMNYSAVGASGAVSGVVLAFCLFFPFQRLFVFFIPMPALLFAVVYIVGSIYAMRQEGPEGPVGGIAHEAHLGGALGGLILTILIEPRAVNAFTSQVLSLLGG
ncbi:MAG: rhomboid family intramembrane serine protease [Bacteroidota bacterium]